MSKRDHILQKIEKVIYDVWKKDIKRDFNYDNLYLLEEDTLKSSFYFHLRTRLRKRFLEKNNIRIFTEYHIEQKKADLIIAIIDKDRFKKQDEHLKNCLSEILAIIEMKYKISNASERYFIDDISKLNKYIKDNKKNGRFKRTKYYFAYIHENETKNKVLNMIENKARPIKILTIKYQDENENKYQFIIK